MADKNDIFRGIPLVLRPTLGIDPRPYELVTDGPRNLTQQPFDYRNPFPVKSLQEVRANIDNGPETGGWIWPIEDRVDTFDYYVNGHAAIGLPGGPECALVDPWGTLRAFTGAWAIGFGTEAAPMDFRVRRLASGPCPVVSAESAQSGMRCRMEFFAAEINGAPDCVYPLTGNNSYQWVGGPAPRGRNFFLQVECRITADANEAPMTVHLGYLQAPSLCAGAFYTKPAYAPAWEQISLSAAGAGRYRLTARHAGQDFVLGLLRVSAGEVMPGEVQFGHWPQPLSLSAVRTAEWLGRVTVAGSAAPRGVRRMPWLLHWTIPMFPLPLEAAACLAAVEHRRQRAGTVKLWKRRRREGLQLAIPEAKVQDAFLQALNHLDLCSVRLAESEFPTPGPSGGHHIFYERDNIDLIHAYDLIGDHARAARMTDHYWLGGVNQEGSGMVLWLLGKHWELTRDRKWVRQILPDARRRMAWLVTTWVNSREANDGLLPATSIPDNELIAGHFVSYHLYALAGARAAVMLAEAAGQARLADQWREFYREFEAAVLRRLEKLVRETGGVLTPGFEGYEASAVTVNVSWVEKPYSYTPAGAYGEKGGCDWHNVGAVFPTEILPPDHPWITSSLARWREAYVEGIFPYPSKGDYTRMHNYNTLNLSGTWLRRDAYSETVRDLYGVLLHTTATHASAEGVDTAGRRDFGCTPHNWFSAKLVRFIRDLLVYEGHDQRLHLLGGLAPAWMMPGMRVGLRAAPTTWGRIGFQAIMQSNGLDLTVEFKPRDKAQATAMVLHLPPFLREVTVQVDGHALPPGGGGWILPGGVCEVAARWAPAPLPEISFEKVASVYIADYRQRCGRA